MSRHSTKSRHAFTLIELLVAIAIIALLMAIFLSAITRTRQAARNAQTSSEIAQIGSAVQAFKTKFNVRYVPSCGLNGGPFRLRTQYATTDPELVYLKSLFPNLPYIVGPLDPRNPNVHPLGTGLDDADLDPGQTLMFFMTGGSGLNYHGFSTNRREPFIPTGGDTVGPFLEVSRSRLDPQGRYLDPWGTHYAFFSTDPMGKYPTSHQGSPVQAYREANGSLINAKSFQIVSAGADQQFGPGGIWTPGVGPWELVNAGGDDLSNFNQGPLVSR